MRSWGAEGDGGGDRWCRAESMVRGGGGRRDGVGEGVVPLPGWVRLRVHVCCWGASAGSPCGWRRGRGSSSRWKRSCGWLPRRRWVAPRGVVGGAGRGGRPHGERGVRWQAPPAANVFLYFSSPKGVCLDEPGVCVCMVSVDGARHQCMRRPPPPPYHPPLSPTRTVPTITRGAVVGVGRVPACHSLPRGAREDEGR